MITIDGDKVYVIPEYWNRFKKRTANRRPARAKAYAGTRAAFKRFCYDDALLLGAYEPNGYYVVISHKRRVSLRGLRVHCGKIYTGGWNDNERQAEINKIIDILAIPYRLEETSTSIGLFFDGTAAFKEETHTNIFKEFESYWGNKFYYGGIGNFKDNNFFGILAGATWADPAQQFFPIIQQAYRDISYVAHKRRVRGVMLSIDVFGMSRGAAQAVELARLLELNPIPGVLINFLGLYEPVYSVGFLRPGQHSELVKPGDVHSNWTRGVLPSNISQVAILYAKNEERTWFSAAFFSYDPEKTVVDVGVLSGSHGSICGPRVNSTWQTCLHTMARSWMRERAHLARVPTSSRDVLPPMCNDLVCVATNTVSRVLDWDYDDFGAGRIQSNQGINIQWLANRLMPWHWGSQAPIKNRYKRDFTPLISGLYRPNINY